MIPLPFLLGGVALAAVVVLHFAWTAAPLAVSGRLGILVNRLRARLRGEREPELDDAAMLEALRAMTAAEFGEGAVDAAGPSTPEAADAPPTMGATSTASHLLFFGGLALGGFLVALARSTFHLVPTLAGDSFTTLVGSGPRGMLALFGGGVLVGVGTRMSGGCTSGHGLIGVPRLERGSLVATCTFFAAGIAVSFALGMLR